MKPKYSFFKNSSYALNGLMYMIKNEVSFKIELSIIVPLIIISFFLKIPTSYHIFIIITMLLILMAECINSAIEAIVDMVMPNYHDLAKIAKDCGSATVFIAIVVATITWVLILWKMIF